MKTIGIVGGMSWESSLEYYRIINQLVKERLGGLHSAKIVLVSLDFAPVEALMSQGKWPQVAEHLMAGARQAEMGGADLLLIATNTMHKLYAQVSKAVSIPVLHIADAAAASILAAGMTRIGLLGTYYTMQQDFYKGWLRVNYGLEVLLPDEEDQVLVDRIIFEELVLGKIEPGSKAEYIRIIEDMSAKGAQGIVLGCTEIMLLVQAQDVSIPVFDTTYLHAEMAVHMALEEDRSG